MCMGRGSLRGGLPGSDVIAGHSVEVGNLVHWVVLSIAGPKCGTASGCAGGGDRPTHPLARRPALRIGLPVRRIKPAQSSAAVTGEYRISASYSLISVHVASMSEFGSGNFDQNV